MLLSLFTFNSGDNYYSDSRSWLIDLFIQIVASLLGFLGAYLIFRSGIRNERRSNDLKEEKRLKDLLTFVRISLESNIEPINSQIKAIDELIAQLKVESVIDIKFTLNTSLDFIEWMKSIDMKDLQRAFFLYYKGDKPHEQYGALIKQLLHLRNVSEFLAGDFNNIIKESNKYEDVFNEGKTFLFEKLDVARKIYNEAQNKYLQYEEIQLIKAVNDFYKEKDEIKRNDMFYTYKYLVSPMIEIAKKNQDPSLLKGIRLAGYAFESYKKVQQINLLRFSNYKQSLETAVKFFPEIIEPLKKIPTVHNE